MDALRRQHISEARLRGAKKRLPERRKVFWSRVQKSSEGCWTWTGTIASNGYGQFSYDGKLWPAHRLAYYLVVGDLDEELTIDHLCRNRACVNPDHLELVSMRINSLRGTSVSAVNARKTHCPRGHEFTAENTRIYKGGRYCRACERERAAIRNQTYNREWRQQNREHCNEQLRRRRAARKLDSEQKGLECA